jgi:hypothetical protein
MSGWKWSRSPRQPAKLQECVRTDARFPRSDWLAWMVPKNARLRQEVIGKNFLLSPEVALAQAVVFTLWAGGSYSLEVDEHVCGCTYQLLGDFGAGNCWKTPTFGLNLAKGLCSLSRLRLLPGFTRGSRSYCRQRVIFTFAVATAKMLSNAGRDGGNAQWHRLRRRAFEEARLS